jgi:hypothetical protein
MWIDEVEIVPEKASTFIDSSALLKYKLGDDAGGKDAEVLSNNAGMLMVLEATDFETMFDSHSMAWAIYFSIIFGTAGYSYIQYRNALKRLQKYHKT